MPENTQNNLIDRFAEGWKATYALGSESIVQALLHREGLLAENYKYLQANTDEKYSLGIYYLKYHYFQPSYVGDPSDKNAIAAHIKKRKLALERAQECLISYVGSGDAVKEKKAEAAFQLAWLYFYDPVLRYDISKEAGKDKQKLARKYLTIARKNGHKRARRYYYARVAANITSQLLTFGIYASVIAGSILIAFTAALAWPIMLAIGVGAAAACTAHWFGFKHWDRFYNKIQPKLEKYRITKALNLFQEKITRQGSPAAQLRDAILYNTGITQDTAEAKRGGRYAQIPKGLLAGVFFMSAALFFFPGLLAMGWVFALATIALTVFVGMASGDANRRVFTYELYNLADTTVSPEESVPVTAHKKLHRVGKVTNWIYGICMGSTVLVVSIGTILAAAAAIVTAPFSIPVLIALSPIFAIAIYASIVVGRSYSTFSFANWLKMLDKNKRRVFNPRKTVVPPLNGQPELKVSVIEKIFTGLGYFFSAPVAISLTLLSVLELHTILKFIPGSNNWLFAGGPVAGAAAPGTAVLYFTSIITAFRTLGRGINDIPKAFSREKIRAFAKADINIGETFDFVKKLTTLTLNSSGNSFISAIPAIKLLTGAIIVGFVFATPIVLPIAITIACLAGLASFCICYTNWQTEMEHRDKEKTVAEQAYDRNILNTIINGVLNVPALLFTGLALGIKGIAKLVAKAIGACIAESTSEVADLSEGDDQHPPAQAAAPQADPSFPAPAASPIGVPIPVPVNPQAPKTAQSTSAPPNLYPALSTSTEEIPNAEVTPFVEKEPEPRQAATPSSPAPANYSQQEITTLLQEINNTVLKDAIMEAMVKNPLLLVVTPNKTAAEAKEPLVNNRHSFWSTATTCREDADTHRFDQDTFSPGIVC